jgi:hypothetical protein
MLQKRIVLLWLSAAFVLLSSWLVCFIYENRWGNADGLLGSVVYKNVFVALLTLAGLGCLLSLGLMARQKNIQNTSLSILSALCFIGFLEGIGHLVIGLNIVEIPPFSFRRFYLSSNVADIKPYPAGDLNPVTGRGHVPNGAYSFANCQGDSIHWTFNSAGANDRPRSVHNYSPAKKRIALIGDSFLEGYMVNNVDRCSNILEKKTGLEHLNFAVNSSNPLNYYLTYKSIVKHYETDVLIIGFLPANDFETQDEQHAYNLVEWPVYVPFWQGNCPNYTLKYSLANVSQSINYGHHTQASLSKVIDSVYSTLSFSGKLKADLLAHSSLFRLLGELNAKNYREGQFTKYEQFTNEEWNYVRYSLSKLICEARSKKIILLSIPTLWDLRALKNGKTNRIDPVLAKFCRQNGVDFIPLVSAFLDYKDDLQKLYVPCDGHWSVQGEAYAADILLHHPVYQASVGLPCQ